MSQTDNILVVPYEDWMRAAVFELFSKWYGGSSSGYEQSFIHAFEHDYQKDKAIRLVALDGREVVGFQSYLYWPYCQGQRALTTYQSGGSIVDQRYRGRGIFAKLLKYPVTVRNSQIDFLMGFPVDMSFASFLRDGWKNPVDLSWYVRVVNPLAMLFRSEALNWSFEDRAEQIDVYRPPGAFVLSTEAEFEAWRRLGRSQSSNYRYFHFHNGQGEVRFDLKCNLRSGMIELIIGNLNTSTPDRSLFDSALKALIRATKRHRFVGFLSIALNGSFSDKMLLACLRRRGFFRLRKKNIHFIVKQADVAGREFEYPAKWQLFRGDIDTW